MKTRLKRALSLALTALMLLMLVPGALASEIVASDPVIPGLALKNAMETEKSAADELFDRLMACATYDEFAAIMNALTEEEIALLDTFTEEQNAELESKMQELGWYDVVTLQTRSFTIEQGSSVTVSIDNMSSNNFSYNCSQSGINATQTTSGYTISVDSDVPAGYYYTLTVTYLTSSSSRSTTDTIYITVVEKAGEEGALIYFLLTPDSNPDSNATDQWSATDTITGTGTVNMGGTTWTDNKNVFQRNATLSKYILSWPDGSEGVTWTLTSTNANFTAVRDAVYAEYKQKLQEENKITDLKKEDITEITLIPYKISKNNGSTPDKHIDCTISVKCTKAYVASFNVQYPGDTGYTNVSSQNKAIIDDVAEAIERYVDGTKVPMEMDVNGVKYVFDGWYNEDGKKVSDADWEKKYTPSTEELADGTVNFYAHYVKAEATLTIRKTLSGNMYDANKTFAFTVTADKDMTYGTTTSKEISFNLIKDQETTITVPVGAKVTVTENPDGYTPTVDKGTLDASSITGENTYGISFTMPDANSTVVFNNDKTATPDTGVLLDSLPYILILAVVVALGAIVFIRKRRNRDDD